MLHTQPSTQEVRWRQEDKEFKASLAWLHHESEASLGCDILFQEEGQKRRAFVSEFYFFPHLFQNIDTQLYLLCYFYHLLHQCTHHRIVESDKELIFTKCFSCVKFYFEYTAEFMFHLLSTVQTINPHLSGCL